MVRGVAAAEEGAARLSCEARLLGANQGREEGGDGLEATAGGVRQQLGEDRRDVGGEGGRGHVVERAACGAGDGVRDGNAELEAEHAEQHPPEEGW